MNEKGDSNVPMTVNELMSWHPPQPTFDIENLEEIESFLFGAPLNLPREPVDKEIDTFYDRTTFKLECLNTESSALATKLALIAGGNGQNSASNSSGDDQINVDAETQARLEALLEAAGIGKLSTTDGKAFADPEVLRKLSSSVSCALDEAAAALSKMKAESENTSDQSNQRTLVEACNDGDVNTVKRLLCEGRSANETTEDGESLLSLACSAGYFELAEVLLSMHANIEDCGAKGECTPLMEAASGGYTDIVRLLVSHGADINATSSTGNTALTYACCGGFEDVVQLLVDLNAHLECHNENGHTPLMEAASGGHVGVASILLSNGAGINTHSNEFKESALTLACYKGHLKMVKFLLQAGADQEHKTDEMHTALMEASMDGHVEVARLLLDSGAQVNMPADSFESPLTLAACGGHVDLAELLIHRGAALEEVNDEGYTPLMEAAREGHEEMVALLLAAGANANAKTEETQETALTLACCGGFLECAEALIRAGADIETGCSTPLMEAAQEGQLELVKFLIAQNAIVTAATSSGDTALSYACENGHTDVADLLLSAGAVLEHETELGRTPLMKAARAGHLCTVQFLISRGADVNHTTKNNEHSVLSLACVCGHLSVVELLLCQGADATHKLKDGSTLLLEASKGGHTAVVQLLLDFPHNFMTLPPESNLVTSPTPEQMTPRVPTQSLPMVVPPQQPDESPELAPLAVGNFEQYEENLDPENLNIKITECADELQNLYMQQLRSNQNPQQQQQQHVEDVARPPDNSFNMSALVTHLIQQGGLLTTTYDYLPPDAKKAVDKDVAVTVDSFLRSMASDGAAGKPRTAESIVEEAQEKLTELEQRIKEAIEKNAQLKSIEIMQNNQMTKEKVEELYKTREEHIHKKQKILEELQKVERELQLKTQQQLKKHYEELKQNEQSSSQRGKPDGQEIDRVNQVTSSSQFLEEIISDDDVSEEILNKTFIIEDGNTDANEWARRNKSDMGNLIPQQNHELSNGSSGLLPQALNKESEDPFCHCIHHPCSQPSHPQPDEPKMDPNQAGMPPVPGFSSQQQLTPYPHLEIDGHTESNHDTPLTLACAGGHEDLVQLLISRGADIEHRDKKGFTPLILAATAGHVGVVSILLEANSDIEAQSERTKDTPLSLACSGGRFEVVDLLLERGANKEHRNVSDYTPLSLAASGGYVNIIKLLLTQGAEINSRTGSKLGISPLMLAAMNGHTTAVQLLLDMGADINAQIETNRNTALTLACFQGRHEVVSLLVDRKANVEHRAKTGLTPLMEAASGGYADVGRVLLDKGADPNAAPVPSSRDTALTIAADKGHYRFCELVLSRGAQVEVRNKKGNTPLWLACNGGHLDVVMLLVGEGADVNAADNRNVIPLMSAFRKGNVQVVKWLATEVSQFPSDAECMRYIATISDRELLKRSHQCMECIVQAKDRQAQEANKFASELLEELDMEKNQEENRKERAARKREKRRLKRKQKSTKKVDEKEDEDEAIEDDFKCEKENVQEIVKQTEKLKITPKTFSSDNILPLSTASVLSESCTNNSTTSGTVSSTNLTSRVQTTLKPSIKSVTSVTMTTSNQSQQSEVKVPPESRRRTHHNESASSSGETSPRIHLRKVRKSIVARSNSAHEPSPPSKTTTQPPRNPPVSSHTYRNSSSISVVTPSPIKVAPSPSKVGPSPGKRGHRREETLGWKEVTRKYPSSTNMPKRIMVSSNLISRVIGRGGCNINAIREVTGAHIDIDKQRKGGHERTVTIKGAAEAIRHAHQLITALIKEDRTDQEISQIIAKAKALASQNLSSKQPVANKMTVTVVAAPMPSKPAWTVPPSIVAHSVSQPRVPQPPTSLVKVGMWSPPVTTSAAAPMTSEPEPVVTSQSKWSSSQSSSASNPSPPSNTVPTSEPVSVNQAVKPVVTVDTVKKALFVAPQSTASAPMSFPPKTTDKPISKPIQTVAPMMSTKVATAPATRLSQTSFGPVGSGLPSHHHVFANSQIASQQSIISTSSNLATAATSHISNIAAMSHVAMSPVQPIAPMNQRSVTPNRVTSGQGGHLSSSQLVSSSSAPPMAFGSIISDPSPHYSAPPSYSPFNSSFTPAAGSSALWNNEPSNAPSPYQSAMNGIIQAEPVDQSKAPGYRGNMKSPTIVENGIIGGSTSQPAASNKLENASPVNSHQGSPNNENNSEVITKPTPIGTERANRRAINPCLPLPTNLNPPPLNQPNFNEDTGIWSYDTISLGNIGMDSLDSNAKYGNWSQVIGPEGTTTTNTSNKPQVTASEMGPPSKLSQNENSAQIRPFYPPQPSYPNRAQPPIGSHLCGNSSVGVVGPQQLQPIGSHLGGAGHNRGNAFTQMQQRALPTNNAMQQQQHHHPQQQPRYQIGPYHLQQQQNDVMSRYMQSMGTDHSNWQMQQQSMYTRQPRVDLYQHKDLQQQTNSGIGGMYNSMPASMGDGPQGVYSDYPPQQQEYPQYFDPNMVRVNNYQNSSSWEQQNMCRPNTGYSSMNGGPDVPLVNGQPSVDSGENHQGWKEWS